MGIFKSTSQVGAEQGSEEAVLKAQAKEERIKNSMYGGHAERLLKDVPKGSIVQGKIDGITGRWAVAAFNADGTVLMEPGKKTSSRSSVNVSAETSVIVVIEGEAELTPV